MQEIAALLPLQAQQLRARSGLFTLGAKWTQITSRTVVRKLSFSALYGLRPSAASPPEIVSAGDKMMKQQA
jgi:hypothetical protein